MTDEVLVPFEVDGVVYRPRNQRYIGPMFKVKEDHPREECRVGACYLLNAVWVANAEEMKILKEEVPEWRDVEWEPDLRL